MWIGFHEKTLKKIQLDHYEFWRVLKKFSLKCKKSLFDSESEHFPYPAPADLHIFRLIASVYHYSRTAPCLAPYPSDIFLASLYVIWLYLMNSNIFQDAFYIQIIFVDLGLKILIRMPCFSFSCSPTSRQLHSVRVRGNIKLIGLWCYFDEQFPFRLKYLKLEIKLERNLKPLITPSINNVWGKLVGQTCLFGSYVSDLAFLLD